MNTTDIDISVNKLLDDMNNINSYIIEEDNIRTPIVGVDYLKDIKGLMMIKKHHTVTYKYNKHVQKFIDSLFIRESLLTCDGDIYTLYIKFPQVEHEYITFSVVDITLERINTDLLWYFNNLIFDDEQCVLLYNATENENSYTYTLVVMQSTD